MYLSINSRKWDLIIWVLYFLIKSFCAVLFASVFIPNLKLLTNYVYEYYQLMNKIQVTQRTFIFRLVYMYMYISWCSFLWLFVIHIGFNKLVSWFCCLINLLIQSRNGKFVSIDDYTLPYSGEGYKIPCWQINQESWLAICSGIFRTLLVFCM